MNKTRPNDTYLLLLLVYQIKLNTSCSKFLPKLSSIGWKFCNVRVLIQARTGFAELGGRGPMPLPLSKEISN